MSLIPSFNLVGGYKLAGIGYGTFAATDEEKLTAALDLALETGYRHIDTAFLYQNEHIIGKVLKKWFDSGKLSREDIFITTKLPGCQPPESVEVFLKKSLESLQLDYVDLYLIHLPVSMDFKAGLTLRDIKASPSDIVATWKKMEEQVDLGRAKTIGVSNFNKNQVKRVLENDRIVPATNQVELHIYLQQPELVKYCNDNGIVIVSYQSLGNPGLNAYMKQNNLNSTENNEDLTLDPVVRKLAAKHGKTPAQILLKFLLQKNIAIIPKSVTPSRIKENFDLGNFSLDAGDIGELEKLDKGNAGRRVTWKDMHKSFVEHPEYPFRE